MSYYDLSAPERRGVYDTMKVEITNNVLKRKITTIESYAADPDTYIRKNCYIILGRLYKEEEKQRLHILSIVDALSVSKNDKVRQTVVYSLGEIGKHDFAIVAKRLELFLIDSYHSVQNGITGAIKQIGNKNPEPVFTWVQAHINSCNPIMKKKLLHGLELRGRTHPEDLFAVLRGINYNNDKSIRKMMIHVIGQISYKKGCIEKVVHELNNWKDDSFIAECKEEIIQVHKQYAKFSYMNPEQVEKYLLYNL